MKTITAALVLAVGGAVGVFAFAQGQKEPIQPERPRPQAVAGAPSPRPGRSFLEARIETARQVVGRELKRFEIDPTYTNAGDQVPAWSRRLMEDRLRLAATPAERLDAVREHRNRMVSFERLILRYTEKGAGSIVEAPKVKYYRLEADQLLAEAGVDPAKEPPVAETERNPAPPPAAPSSAPPAGPR